MSAVKICGGIVAALFMCGIAIGASVQVGSARALEPGSCGRSRTARDFLAPLERIAPIHQIPSSGKLPFGPAGLTVWTEGRLVVGGGGAVGYRFSDEAIGQRRKLHWRVEVFLYKVSRTGRVLSQVGSIRRRLGVVKGNKIEPFLLDVPGSPAFYRADLGIWKLGTDRPLGTFSEYARVVRPREDLRVKMDDSTVFPGEMARARLINLGTLPIESPSYTFGFGVWRFDGASWVPLAENPPRGPVLKRMQILGPGSERRGCLRYLVPEDAPPGRYRFQAGSPYGFQAERLAAGFEVVSTALGQ